MCFGLIWEPKTGMKWSGKVERFRFNLYNKLYQLSVSLRWEIPSCQWVNICDLVEIQMKNSDSLTVSCMFQLRHLWERTSTSSGWGFMERGRQEGWYIQDVGSQSFSRSCHLRRKQSLPDCVFKSYMGNSCMLPMPNWCLIGLYKHNGNGHGNLPIEPSLLLSHSICVCELRSRALGG